jgi:hypothetical protein
MTNRQAPYFYPNPTPDEERQVDFLYDEFLRRLNLQDTYHDGLTLKLEAFLGFVFTITVAYFAAGSPEPVLSKIISLITDRKGLNIHTYNPFHIEKVMLLNWLLVVQYGLQIATFVFIVCSVIYIVMGLRARHFKNPGSPDIEIRNTNYISKKHIQAIGFKDAYFDNFSVHDKVAGYSNKAIRYFIIFIILMVLSFVL